MVFASIREQCEQAIFLGARAEAKKLLCEQRAVWRVQLASSEHFLYLPLATIHMEILLFIIKQKIFKRGFNLERTKFFEASLNDALWRSNQLQSRLMPNDVIFLLHFITHVFVQEQNYKKLEEPTGRANVFDMTAGMFYFVWFLGHTNNKDPLVEISWWPPQTRSFNGMVALKIS